MSAAATAAIFSLHAAVRRVLDGCRCLALCGIGLGCAVQAHAQDQGPADAPMAADGAAAPLATIKPQLVLSTAPVPTLDNREVASRVRIEVTGWSRGPESSGLGVSMGNSVRQAQSPGYGLAPLPARGTANDVDLAVRWRSEPLGGSRRVDVAAWRRVTPDPADLALASEALQPTYGARVEMQFASARSRRLVPELGAIGMQLDSGAKLSLRAKRGKPMLYYRASF